MSELLPPAVEIEPPTKDVPHVDSVDSVKAARIRLNVLQTELSRYQRLLSRAEDDVQTIEAKTTEAADIIYRLSNALPGGQKPDTKNLSYQYLLSQVHDALTVVLAICTYYSIEK